MPLVTTRPLHEDQIPTFMSPFDLDTDTIHQSGLATLVDPTLMGMEANKTGASQPQLRPAVLPTTQAHRHGQSTRSTTESAESSPTTSLSCTDLSELSDPSPSSSPDSPVTTLPLPSFTPAPLRGLSSGMSTLAVSDRILTRPMTSPGPRRPKNMKGLSIQPPFNPHSSSPLSSIPSSPSFIKPVIPAMKRKPSQLSMKTNASDLMARPSHDTPASPAVGPILQRRALKHSTSSPHMLSVMKSATFGPVGGMTIPTVLERNESGLSEFFRPSKTAAINATFDTTIMEEDSPIKTQVANRAAFDHEPFHEVENNEDQKTPSYPEGPICIYGDNVYLYLEPTAQEASRFDVVINVAREVRNPFRRLSGGDPTGHERKTSTISTSSVPDTAATTGTFETAFEYLSEASSSETPTTPKAAHKEPEYIHMPWDHNTDISEDLMTLCETIAKKTSEGKKVLIHCQQGASRSASLIIAYGLYQNPELSVNDAYHAAQAKSRWISPNMRLMYCLQDFQKEVAKRKEPGSGLASRGGRSPTKHRSALSADDTDIPQNEPSSAPLPDENCGSKVFPEKSTGRARGLSATAPARGEPISPGPSSAPSRLSLSGLGEKENGEVPGLFGPNMAKPSHLGARATATLGLKPPPSPGFPPASFVQPPLSPSFPPPQSFGDYPPLSLGLRSNVKPGPFGIVPLGFGSLSRRKERDNDIAERHILVTHGFPDDSGLMSPRTDTITKNPLHVPFPSFPPMQFVQVPPTPSDGGMFSPREVLRPRDTDFPLDDPLHVDPRSPPTVGEAPIVRSIDEML